MRTKDLFGATLIVGTLFGMVACESPLEPNLADTTELQPGDSRVVELVATPFDVRNFKKEMTREDLLRLPVSLRERMWLLNLDLSGNSTHPALFDFALEQIRNLDLEDPALTTAEKNMVRLLSLSPDTADLSGTALEPLLSLSAKIGFAPADILAASMGITPNERFLGTGAVKAAILQNVVSTHPNAQRRPGPVTADHPDGFWPVPVGHMPVMLEDALTDMATLAERFGPYSDGATIHPGFLFGESKAKLLTEDFKMTVRANLNALPFPGVDLSHAARVGVNSVGVSADGMFDFNSSDWLEIDGLNPDGPKVDLLTFGIVEYPDKVEVGTTSVPWPYGDSPLWALPAWTLERVVAEAALVKWGNWSVTQEYFLGKAPDPVAILAIDDGWLQATTKADLGNPPAPGYLWDVLTEVAQVRLHDGNIPEGNANVQFVLKDVPVGLTNDDITTQIRESLSNDPFALVQAARFLFSNAGGDADIFYVRTPVGTDESLDGDWLYYINADDIRLADNGEPVRDFGAYLVPGFFSDAALTQKISATSSVAGDSTHEKVHVHPGDMLFLQDDQARVFQLNVLPKESTYTCRLLVTRIK
ncbi:MAG: hypothetical protein HUU55_01780 [Myxococcales bacterium]|nr:hypothetical protein [Myxococcales bacterium]